MTKSDKKVGEAIPGIYINRFLVMAGPDNWRIVFIDAIEGVDGVAVAVRDAFHCGQVQTATPVGAGVLWIDSTTVSPEDADEFAAKLQAAGIAT